MASTATYSDMDDLFAEVAGIVQYGKNPGVEVLEKLNNTDMTAFVAPTNTSALYTSLIETSPDTDLYPAFASKEALFTRMRDVIVNNSLIGPDDLRRMANTDPDGDSWSDAATQFTF